MINVDSLEVQFWLEKYCEIKPASPQEIRLKTCPKCGSSKFKLYVNIEKLIWICFKCNYGVKNPDIVVLLADVSGKPYQTVCNELNESIKSTTSDLAQELDKIYNPEIKEVDKIYTRISLPGTDDINSITFELACRYALFRGLSQEDISTYKLRGSARLRTKVGPFLVFPILYTNVPVGYQGRRVADSDYNYVSCDDIANWVYPVQDLFLKQNLSTVVIVEGIFDALGLWRMNIPSFCTFGKKISKNQILLLKKLNVENLILFWDLDASNEIENATFNLRKYFKIKVANQFKPDNDDRKIDPGLSLQDPSVSVFIKTAIDTAIEIDSSDFHYWKLSRRLQNP